VIEMPKLYSMVIQSLHDADSVFGLAGSMWDSMYSLAGLVSRKTEGKPIAAEAQDLALSLLTDPNPCPEKPSGSTVSDDGYESLFQIANAYRSALVVLYTDLLVDEITVSSDFVQSLYESALHSLLRASTLTSDVMLTTLWPLHTVGMRATSRSDKMIIRKIFEKLKETHHKNCVNSAWDEVQRSWAEGQWTLRHENREILFA
jgi:hypothetical protein